MSIQSRDQLLEAGSTFLSDGGAFRSFDLSLKNLSQIFRENAIGVSPDLHDRLVGHSGLNGEWMNGLASALMLHLLPHFSEADAFMKDGTIEDGFTAVLKRQHGRSQLSLGTAKDGDEKDYQETTRDAYERCGRELRDWFNSQIDLPAETRQKAQTALDEYEAQWGHVKGFLDYAAAYFSQQPA